MSVRGVVIGVSFLVLLFSFILVVFFAGFGLSSKLKPIPWNKRISCDANSPCKSGRCYLYAGEKQSICYVGNPCTRCKTKGCTIADGYPAKVRCE